MNKDEQKQQEEINKQAIIEFENVGDEGLFPNHSDKDIWMKGFQTGYNRAKPDELSHELRYKDGTPMRKYNSPKLQAIEMEISDEEIEKAAKECRFEDLDISVGSFELGAKWYREQLRNKQNFPL
jgi:hypothetical protein